MQKNKDNKKRARSFFEVNVRSIRKDQTEPEKKTVCIREHELYRWYSKNVTISSKGDSKRTLKENYIIIKEDEATQAST